MNPFISRVEADVRALQTVFVDQHQLLSGYGRITQVRTEPMWIQVIHGGNIANVVRGIRADPSESAHGLRRICLISSQSGDVACALSKP